ncbi:Aminoacyl-tRNA editing domain-containing protein [Alicyclobacillus tolerans]|uniref:Aminoacyl-tRNA editing domain-containing protein n=1 Tax=Alicyclobacillus tolerans TaxID=90970 RepID=A0A1M6TNK9_9BACL|nr:Aminoacyl-tRNA editing domain-containing protein [Alicyclobacillus montanus]
MEVASGVNLANDKLLKSDADFVRERTGFVIGGVPTLGHKETIPNIIDEDLFQFKPIWEAAGHLKAVFELTPDQLVGMTKGRVMMIK